MRRRWDTFRGGFSCNMGYCLLFGYNLRKVGGGGSFQLYFLSFLCFPLLLTIARSRVLDFQQHPHRAGGLLHGTFAGICGVVAGTHRLVRPALGTGIHADRAAAPARPIVPQTLLSCAARDGLTRLGLWTQKKY